MFVFPNSENRQLATSLSRAELTRADEFAQNALNNLTAMNRIKQIFIDWGLNMEEYLNESNDLQEFAGVGWSE